MKRFLITFTLGLLIGGASVFTSLKYHIVRAEDGFHLIPKTSADFAEIYADIREFKAEDWKQHQSLATAIAQTGKKHLLAEETLEQLEQTAENVPASSRRGPARAPKG
jgi:hypothetical protein